jgi:glycosyltransferase involved in cell wall biosynthesis
MKILILIHEFPPVGGGAANACAHLARELAGLGVEVEVLTASFRGLPRLETRDGYTVRRTPVIRRHALQGGLPEMVTFLASALLSALARTGRGRRPDLVHAFFGLPAGFLAYVVRRVRGIPYVISLRGRDVHGGHGPDAGAAMVPHPRASRPAWDGASALVAVGEGLRAMALSFRPGSEVEVIPNGVDTVRYAPEPSRTTSAAPDATRNEPRARSESPAARETPFRVLYSGRLESYKRVPDLLEGFRLLRDRAGRPVSLRIVGGGSLLAALSQVAWKKGISYEVIFEGHLGADAMPRVYREADAMVLPSVVEGMPNVVLEAMASGLPVVATRVPGSEELLRDGETGLLVPPGDPEAIAAALGRLLESPDLRRAIADRARAEVERRSWKAAAEAYLSLYRKVLEREP